MTKKCLADIVTAAIAGTHSSPIGEAKSVFIIGYSLPETDAFFRLLYALGTVGPSPLERVIIYNPDKSGGVNKRFKEMLGPGAVARYEYKEMSFDEAIGEHNHCSQVGNGT